MQNPTENDEREYLELIKERLVYAIRRIDDAVRQFATEFRQNKEYNYDNKSGMDDADLVAADQAIKWMTNTGEYTVARKRKLLKLGNSPYFGRIDFVSEKKLEADPIYIGIYSFSEGADGVNTVYDWRAPVSSMFYDFELGEAWYSTPAGKVNGTILLKRQYRIRDGRMEFMIENSVNIHDDVLQKELSKNADEKMKNIVATIQRDQNAVIRNETAPVMIIQGVAGSGKTSIALHRIAFLLYRFRETLASKDILIISPNKVFADYISNVLPELGEEHIPEMVMEDLASEVLEGQFRFQSFFQQVSAILGNSDRDYIERIKFKSSFEFLSQLNKYFVHMGNHYLKATDLRVAGTIIAADYIKNKFMAYQRMPLLKRMPEVVKEVLQEVRNKTKRKISGREKSLIWETVPKMFLMGTVLDVYRDFFTHLGKPEMFRMSSSGLLEYADVFPLIYCKIRLEGLQTFDHVKHLLVDEMQDYTPIQYAVLSRLFRCNKTILGDVSQTVNPYSASSADDIEKVFPQAEVVKLFRSYRSTLEITSFAQRINANAAIAMERHGPEPVVSVYANSKEEYEALRQLIHNFQNSGHRSQGIICKTLAQAQSLHRELATPNIHLLTPESIAFAEGAVITTAHLAKGLEFDEVIIPYASFANYHNEVDKSMLYIACTRAMHRLTLTCVGEPTRLVS